MVNYFEHRAKFTSDLKIEDQTSRYEV